MKAPTNERRKKLHNYKRRAARSMLLPVRLFHSSLFSFVVCLCRTRSASKTMHTLWHGIVVDFLVVREFVRTEMCCQYVVNRAARTYTKLSTNRFYSTLSCVLFFNCTSAVSSHIYICSVSMVSPLVQCKVCFAFKSDVSTHTLAHQFRVPWQQAVDETK